MANRTVPENIPATGAYLKDDFTWGTPGGGDVSKVGTPVNNQVGVWTGDGTIEGDTDLQFDGTKLSVGGIDTMTVNGSLISTHLAIHGADGITETEVEMHRHGDTAGAGAAIYGARSRGSLGAETIVQSGDALLNYTAVGYDGTDYATAAQIQFEVDGTPGNNDMPGRIVFNTSADGSQALTERMRISANGNVNITGLTASQLTATDGSKNLQSLTTATYPSLTEVSYVKGVTSAIQTQLDGKVTSGGALGTPSSGTLTNATGLPVAGITSSTSTALGVGSLEIGHASDTTLTRTASGMAAIEGKGLITRVIVTALTNGSGATHNFQTGMQYCEVWCTGCGGGGGGANATDATSQATGSGGGAGGTAYAVYTAAEAGSSALWTVSITGGTGGGDTGTDGGTGTSSTFDPAGTGATITGAGGAPGIGHSNTTPAASIRDGGNGGNGSNGTVNFTGGDGGVAYTATTAGTTIPIWAGYGGASYWGGGARGSGRATAGTAAGRAGQVYGAGGSGGACLNSSGGIGGGQGGPGIIVVKEYCQ